MDEFSNKNKPKQIYKLKKNPTKQNKPPKTKRYYAANLKLYTGQIKRSLISH